MTNACSRWMATCVDMFEHPIVGMNVPPPPAADETRHAQQPMIAWQDLLRSAAYAEKKINHKLRVITLKRGEFLAGRSFWAIRWNWGEKAVRNFFDRLIVAGMIAIQGQSKGHTANIASICNYDVYQRSKDDSQPEQRPVVGQCEASGGPVVGQTLQGNTILKDDTREREVSDQATTQQVEALEQTASVMRGALPTFGADLVDFVNVGGKPVPTTKAKAYWLERFGGDAARLETALLEATPEIAQKSPMAFSNGVVRRLGQIAGRRMDMAANHAKAVKANANGRKPQFGEDGHEHRVSSETKKFVRPAGYDYPPEAGRGA